MVIGDPVFANAVTAIDTGDTATLDTLIALHPRLVTDRLVTGEQGYFADPYLLWFVAGNPIRNDRLPANIVHVAGAIVRHLDRLAPASRQDQLDYTVMLTATGRVPRESGVQLALIDALVSWGAKPGGLDSTVAHGEFAAARRLLHHGAPLNLVAAVALGMTAEAAAMLPAADAAARADALVVAASLGVSDGVAMLLAAGVDPNVRSLHLHRHATALHEAALTGKEDLCLMLVKAGASLTIKDDMWTGTPAGWARHVGHESLARLLTPPP